MLRHGKRVLPEILAVGEARWVDDAGLDVGVGARDDALELHVRGARVDGVVEGDGPRPENALDVGCGRGVFAPGAREEGGDALDEDADGLAVEFGVALGGAGGEVVGDHFDVAAVVGGAGIC